VLLAVLVAMMWGLGPAVVAAFIATFGDNLLLREPFGRPTIGGVRDLIDLALFVTVACIVAWLVSRARQERARADEARQQQDRLVAMIAHDLATPLSTIRGSAQFAAEFGRQPNVDMERVLNRIESAASRASSMVKTLRDLRAVESGSLALALEPCDYGQLVESVVEMFDRTSPRHVVNLTTPELPVVVQGDKDRLQSVIENLIGNAIKYSPDGGSIDVTLTVQQGMAILTVRDWGVGITEADARRVFERGYRVPATSTLAPGLGLGLAIVEEVVLRHRGSVRASPANPRGTAFTVSIPVAESPAPVRREPSLSGG
jgi:signal transduction histidine kinase